MNQGEWVYLLICLVSRQRFLLHIQLPSYLFTLSVIFFHQVFIHRPSIILSNQVSYRGGRGWGLEYTFLNLSPPPPWNFSFFYFTPWNSRQSKAQPLEIPHYFFLGHPQIPSTSFFINPCWKFHRHGISLILLEISYPQPPSPVLIFSGIAHWSLTS